MARKEELDAIVTEWAHRIKVPTGVQAVPLLKAILMRESKYGLLTAPRREPAYMPKGRYFTPEQADRYRRYGTAAACSYSSFQIMFPLACELGYKGSPLSLGQDTEAIRWVVEYLNVRIFGKQHAQTVDEVADAYNSGSCRDRFKPIAYMQAVRGYYKQFAA